MAFFYTYENSPENEKLHFLQTLYHDQRGGQMIRLRKNRDQVSQLSTCDMDELAATGTDRVDTYTTVNTFRGYKRTSETVFNVGSIYIDLDCHADDTDQVQDAKRRTVEILEAAYADGSLAVPTMITDTGRGFGLQYILTKSIANTWKTQKIQAFYKKTRKCLYEKYREILSVDPRAAQPDAAVMDGARVCRIPGTYNTVADAYCRLICVSEKFYELSDIVQESHLWDWKSDEEYQKEKTEKEKRKKEIAFRSVVSFAEYRLPFLTTRLEQLEKLQELRGENCEGYREQMLFIAYSALVQLDPISAAQRLQEMNGHFSDPLPQAELDHIIRETDQSIGVDHRGYYKIPNTYVIDTLGLTDDEIKSLGIGQGLKRATDRRVAREKKKETREKIVELLSQADSLTYEEIADATGVSRRTICTIAKNEGLMRYAKVAERQNSQEKEAEIITIESVRDGAGQVAKSAKIATGSVCAHLPDSCASFFSTPAERGAGGEDYFGLEWLHSRASSDAVAKELLHLVEWSAWDSYDFGVTMEEFLARKLNSMSQPERLTSIRDAAAKKFFVFYKSECAYLFGTYDVAKILPTVWNLFTNSEKRKTVKKPHFVVDVTTETPEQREARIERHLKNYSDKRFDIIEASDEYQIRLDPDVIRMVKVVCMQVNRLKRDYFLIEKKQVPTKDIKQCFDSLTYKDLAIICERMQHHGMLQTSEKPFFYVLQVVWKYKHQDAAEAQADRLMKNTNSFFDFETHNYEDLDALAMRKALRRLQGQKGIGVSIGNE